MADNLDNSREIQRANFQRARDAFVGRDERRDPHSRFTLGSRRGGGALAVARVSSRGKGGKEGRKERCWTVEYVYLLFDRLKSRRFSRTAI